MTTNLGKWERWYAGLSEPQPYGDSPTYLMGAEFLDGLHIEDWGCGKGWMRRYVAPYRYTGIDGSRSPFADVVTDLVDYTSTTEGIFMRHVLEHDRQWDRILTNAVASFTRRMFLVLFTPLAEFTHEIAWNEDPGVPDTSFAIDDLASFFADLTWDYETINSSMTQYGVETVIRLEKP